MEKKGLTKGYVLLIVLGVIIVAFITNVYAQQGFTVTSVSLTNILHPGQNSTNTQWLIQAVLNGGGQSLVGTFDNSTINYQGFTSAYPLQISGNTDPEKAFYNIDNSNLQTIYSYYTEVFKGNITNYVIYISATNASKCSNNVFKEWDFILDTGWFGLGDKVTVGRVCIYKKQIGSETSIPSQPDTQFSSHFLLSANGQQETLNVNSGQFSATSPDGLIQADWVGSFVTGNAPPDGRDYVAISSPNLNNWIVKSLTDYQNYQNEYQSTQTQIKTLALYPDTLPGNCSKITPSSNNQYITDATNCLSDSMNQIFFQSNQDANNLLTNGVSIHGYSTVLSNNGAQQAFQIQLPSNFVTTNPVITLRLNGSFIGVVIPYGKPKILTTQSDCFNSGNTGTIKLQVQNIGNSQGSFYASLLNCPNIATQTQSIYSVGVGNISEIDVPIFSTGRNQQINESCQVNVTDYNGGGSDMSNVNLCMEEANQCQPDTYQNFGNYYCPCVQVNGIYQFSDGIKCKICDYGVFFDSGGNLLCSQSPELSNRTCPDGEVFLGYTQYCVNISQLIGFPSDSPCQSGWPLHQGSTVSINENNNACDLFEVKNPQLESIAQEAATCFSTKCEDSNCHDYCYQAYSQSGADYYQSDSVFKKFAALYMIYGLGPAAKFMKNYFSAEINCWWGQGTCSPTTGYNSNVQQLKCRGPVGKPDGWASDTDMSQNSCMFSDLPAHVNIDILHTGTCVDYSVSLTTLLRQVGYSNDEVYSVTGPGHEFNLVKFPGDDKWTLVDTVGNYNHPYTPFNHPSSSYPYYCNYSSNSCSNDLGQGGCPSKTEIYGC